MKTKHLLITLTILFLTFNVSAQQGINYKAIINDADGNVLLNTPITVQFTILHDGTTEVYKESHNPTTDAHGIIIVNIGEGAAIDGAFDAVDWGGALQYLKTEIDKGEGLTDMGTTEFKTVPYALHAITAKKFEGTLPGTPNLAEVLTTGNEANAQIKNVIDPTENQDVATKAYVDAVKTIIYDELLEAGMNGILKDVDGNTYKTVKIGDQVWMAENLKTTKYSDGTDIPLVEDGTTWEHLSTPAYCWFNNDIATGNTYGALYNWYVVDAASNGGKNVCPTGWHVPTDAEWRTLTTYLGGLSVAGGKLKETGTVHWRDPNTGATNETGFTALPGGYRSYSIFVNRNTSSYWWSATGSSSYPGALGYLVTFDDNDMVRDDDHKVQGSSVRCLRD